jgi:hypothetical protein
MKEIWKECTTEYLDTIEGKFNKVPKHHILDLAENVDEVLKACDAFINDCSCLLDDRGKTKSARLRFKWCC